MIINNKSDVLNIQVIIDPITECHIIPDRPDYPTGIFGGRYIKIHRIIAHLWYGLSLSNPYAQACHKCNNRKCINPEHIYSGDNSTNTIDQVKSGTHVQGRKTHHTCGRHYDVIVKRDGEVTERYCSYCRRLANRRFRRKNK